MIASRPNGVQNHGTPAYGNAPSRVSVVIIARSAVERAIQSLNAGLDVRTLASSCVKRSIVARAERAASSNVTARGSDRPSASCRHWTPISRSVRPIGARWTANSARFAVSAVVGRSNVTIVRRTTPSSPV